MAEDSDERTEPASARRRQEAADAGNFARSQDLTAAVLLLSGLIVIYTTGPALVQRLAAMMRALLGPQPWIDQRQLVEESIRIAAAPMVRILLPIFLTVFVVSALVTIYQVGIRFTTTPLMPNLARLNPVAGLGRLFGGQNWFQLGMNVAKLVTVATLSYVRFQSDLPLILQLSGMDFPQNMAVACGIVYGLAIRIAVALFILGILDWFYHKWKFERDLRMTKMEIKDEAKTMEGDPEIKARRRGLARKMILQRIHADVPRADVVVTNPTHLAIAIKYDPATMSAPRVIAKGADFLAMRIRQVALQNGVPLVEKKELAQALYKTVEVGQEVPPQFYQAIAEILAYVYELSGKATRMRAKAG